MEGTSLLLYYQTGGAELIKRKEVSIPPHMKRLVMEVPYQSYWANFFGRHYERIKVVEALKCFKCDNEGFALICKIKLRDSRFALSDLRKGGAIKTIETLDQEEDE